MHRPAVLHLSVVFEHESHFPDVQLFDYCPEKAIHPLADAAVSFNCLLFYVKD